MPVGKIKLNSNILDNYTQKNFETYMDGIGKPISKSELTSVLKIQNTNSPLISDSLAYSNSVLSHLNKEVRNNVIIKGIEKSLNATGKAIGLVTTTIKNLVSDVLKVGIKTLDKALKKVAKIIKDSPVYKFIQKAVRELLTYVGIPLILSERITGKVANLISKGLESLGLKNSMKNSVNKQSKKYLDKGLDLVVKKAMYTGILIETPKENDGVYVTAKKLINSDPETRRSYDSVIKSLNFITFSNMKEEDDYYNAMYRINGEYRKKYGKYPPLGFNNKEEEEFFIRTVINRPEYGRYDKLNIEDESRGWMGYDPNFLSEMTEDELIMLSKNKNISKFFPYGNVSGQNYKDYFNSLTKSNTLTNYEKMIIYSEYKKEQYYSSVKKKYPHYGTVTTFNGFTNKESLPNQATKNKINIKKDRTTSL